MSSSIDGLRLRKVMGRGEWLPPEPYGPDGWRMMHRAGDASIIATAGPAAIALLPANIDLWHASITGRDMPTYEDLTRLHAAVWGDEGYSYQCFVPPAEHVNIHPRALHLWGLTPPHRLIPDLARTSALLGRTI